jgi:hypothetical protein
VRAAAPASLPMPGAYRADVRYTPQEYAEQQRSNGW